MKRFSPRNRSPPHVIPACIKRESIGHTHRFPLETCGNDIILARGVNGYDLTRPAIDESDLISINYTSGTTARPKGVMITHRNAYLNVVGTLVHHSLAPRDRYLWTLPMFHANGWTFVWIVTARGAAHICLRKVEPSAIFELIESENISIFCAAPTVLIGVVKK